MKSYNLLVDPRFLIIAGVCLVIESILTPGFQLTASLIGGGLIGWNIGRWQKGDY